MKKEKLNQKIPKANKIFYEAMIFNFTFYLINHREFNDEKKLASFAHCHPD
jgi:hypothetical protein